MKSIDDAEFMDTVRQSLKSAEEAAERGPVKLEALVAISDHDAPAWYLLSTFLRSHPELDWGEVKHIINLMQGWIVSYLAERKTPVPLSAWVGRLHPDDARYPSLAWGELRRLATHIGYAWNEKPHPNRKMEYEIINVLACQAFWLELLGRLRLAHGPGSVLKDLGWVDSNE